jgi:hypothetical protein
MFAVRENQFRRSPALGPPEAKDEYSALWDSGLLGAVMLALVLYVSAYCLLVRAGGTIWFTPNGKKILVVPNYRGVPSQIFAPIHYLDRNLIRPHYWGAGGRTWAVQKQIVVSGTGAILTPSTSSSPSSGSLARNHSKQDPQAQ